MPVGPRFQDACLNSFHILFWCYHSSLWTNKYRMDSHHSAIFQRNLNNRRDYELVLFWEIEQFPTNIYLFNYISWEPNESLQHY